MISLSIDYYYCILNTGYICYQIRTNRCFPNFIVVSFHRDNNQEHYVSTKYVTSENYIKCPIYSTIITNIYTSQHRVDLRLNCLYKRQKNYLFG